MRLAYIICICAPCAFSSFIPYPRLLLPGTRRPLPYVSPIGSLPLAVCCVSALCDHVKRPINFWCLRVPFYLLHFLCCFPATDPQRQRSVGVTSPSDLLCFFAGLPALFDLHCCCSRPVARPGLLVGDNRSCVSRCPLLFFSERLLFLGCSS